MNRGHILLEPERGEWRMTLRGVGELRLNRKAETANVERGMSNVVPELLPHPTFNRRALRMEPMNAGSALRFDGRDAHGWPIPAPSHLNSW
jgi:hypothetical protein